MTHLEFLNLKPGDQVVIVPVKRGINWDPDGKMERWLGKTMTIKRILKESVKMKEDVQEFDGDGWHWFPHMLEYKIGTVPQERKIDMIITENERQTLINKIAQLLEEYEYDYDTISIGYIVDEWAKNKRDLISLFKKHPNYMDGKFMIAFESDFNRTTNFELIENFIKYINEIKAKTYLLNEEIENQRIKEECTFLPTKIFNWITSNFSNLCDQFLTEDQVNIINDVFPTIRAHIGQKTSRVVNKIMTYLGYSKHEDYNREYAKYSDGLNPLKITRHTVLSINPLDYLTMSFGTNWASCHTIDKTNRRKMPNDYQGCYSSGTESYMLDSTSMVFYTVDKSYNGTEYYTQPKVNRQMFHFGEDKLIQGRLYPQDNDNNREGYTGYRNIVQSIMAQILDIPNLWKLEKGVEAATKYVLSYGTHYCDYEHFENCNLSTIKGSENEKNIDIGHYPICPKCGYEHDSQESILCEDCYETTFTCDDCGCTISEDDVIFIDGYPYCRGCVEFCDNCDTYHRENSTYVEGIGYVCETCLQEYCTYCEECDNWVKDINTTYIESEGRAVCYDCLNNNFTKCEQCGEYIRNEDVIWINEVPYCEKCAKKEEE